MSNEIKLNDGAKKVLDEHLSIFAERYTDDFEQDIKERHYRRTKTYSDFHSRDSLNALSLSDFKEKIFGLWAFSGWANKDWFFENTMKVSSENLSNVTNCIADLCFGDEDITERVNQFLESTNGMRNAFMSEILYLATDAQYPIFNQKAKTVIEQLGIDLKGNLPRGKKRDRGLIYKEFVGAYSAILKYVTSKNPKINDFEKLDTLFWKVNYSDDASPISGVNDKVSQKELDTKIIVVKLGSRQREFHRLIKEWKGKSIASFGREELAGYDPSKTDGYNYADIQTLMKSNGAPDGLIKKIASYVQAFHNARCDKDWVVAYFKGFLHGFGKVSKKYHAVDSDWGQAIGVNWTWLEEPIRIADVSRALYSKARHNSSVNIVDNQSAISDFLDIVEEHGEEEAAVELERETESLVGNATIESLAESSFMTLDRLSFIEHSLLHSGKRQAIFDGVPGTGKTWIAKLFGDYLANKEGKSVGDCKVVSCHGGTTFEELFQGLSPDGKGGLKSVGGIVADFAERAAENSDAYYVIVFDEINRANIPQVFGQMLYLLEYRGEEIDLPYDGESISLPENLIIIATMNSEDRSVGVLDFAFRRRYSHFRFDPDVSVLRSWLHRKHGSASEVNIDDICRIFADLNKQLVALDENFQIGHAYFMTEYPLTRAGLERLWETDILPLLEERFYHSKKQVLSDFAIDRFLEPTSDLKKAS